MSRIRRLVQPSSANARSGNWLMPGLLAIAVACAALVSACEVEPEQTDHSAALIEHVGEHAGEHAGAAVFIGEDGVAQEVPKDHVWVEADPDGDAYPHPPKEIDATKHGGIATVDHSDKQTTITFNDGTVLELEHNGAKLHRHDKGSENDWHSADDEEHGQYIVIEKK